MQTHESVCCTLDKMISLMTKAAHNHADRELSGPRFFMIMRLILYCSILSCQLAALDKIPLLCRHPISDSTALRIKISHIKPWQGHLTNRERLARHKGIMVRTYCSILLVISGQLTGGWAVCRFFAGSVAPRFPLWDRKVPHLSLRQSRTRQLHSFALRDPPSHIVLCPQRHLPLWVPLLIGPCCRPQSLDQYTSRHPL